jgi:iduronate 2-sulfatase
MQSPLRRLFAAGLLAAVCLSPGPAPAADRPNVLFLICDDLNCDLGSYGHPQVKSPNIDRLAARGRLFERAYCQYPLCGPSRAAFMTGMYPDQTLVRRNAIYIREHVPNVQTMSQMFRDAGYFATRIGKIYHYNVPLHVGTSGHDDPYSWDYTINPRGQDMHDMDSIFTLVKGQYGGTMSWRADPGPDSAQTDGIAALEAVKLLQQHSSDKTPFYMAVGLYRPHTPYVAPKKYFDMYPLDKIVVPKVPEGYLETIPKPAQQSIRRKKDQIDLPDETARKAIQAYYASITFADAQLGVILDALDATGLAKNTVVLFTSDHGYHMGEHGHWQKTTLFENAARVPLIIAGPGVSAPGKRTTGPVEMTDFYPTLAELCGLKPPPSVSGVSLVPALKDPSAAPRQSALTQYANGYSIRTERWRYTEWGENGKEGNELYDHETDPAEMVNLASRPEHAARIKELSAHLRERIANANQPPQGVKQVDFENNRRVPR